MHIINIQGIWGATVVGHEQLSKECSVEKQLWKINSMWLDKNIPEMRNDSHDQKHSLGGQQKHVYLTGIQRTTPFTHKIW